MKRFFAVAALLAVLGNGCSLGASLPIGLPDGRPNAEQAREKTSLALPLKGGLDLEIRPTVLGVSGSVEDALGRRENVMEARVEEATGDRLAISWKKTSSGASVRGNILSERFDERYNLLLPAFWKEGEAAAPSSGLVWLSGEAYRNLLETAAADVPFGIPDERVEKSIAAMNAFTTAAGRLVGATGTASLKTFRLEKRGDGAFPIRVNGGVKFAAVMLADSPLAEFVILKNPENPLVLKVNFKALALGALQAFSGLGVDPAAAGYEITSIRFP